MPRHHNGSIGPENVANRPGQIPPEHIPLTMNSLLCERLYNFARTLRPDGSFAWSAEKDEADGSKTPITDLLDFVNDVGTAYGLLTRLCAHQQWGWQVSQDVGSPMVQVVLFLHDRHGEVQVIATTTGSPIGLAISLCIAAAMKLDPATQHRLLYPGHYMALS